MKELISDAPKRGIVGINAPLEALSTWMKVRIDWYSQVEKYFSCMTITYDVLSSPNNCSNYLADSILRKSVGHQ